MKMLLYAAMLTSAIVAAPAAATTVINFDNLSGGTDVQNSYNGLTFSNFTVQNTNSLKASGYYYGLVSGSNVAFSTFGLQSTISAASPFIFNSGYFSSAWQDGMSVVVTGYVGGVATYSSTFGVSSTGSTLETFNWTNLSSISFIGVGGTQNPAYLGHGPHIGFDDLTFFGAVAAAVPEPSTWIMMIGGMGMAGGAMRRRKSAVRTSVSFAV